MRTRMTLRSWEAARAPFLFFFFSRGSPYSQSWIVHLIEASKHMI